MGGQEYTKINRKKLGDIPEKPGVYQIKWSNEIIGRLLGKDKEGILMIGEGVNLRRRIRQFLTSIEGGSRPHAQGARFRNLKLHERIGIDKLEVKLSQTENKENAMRKEDEFLKYYQQKFGELPPLNNKGGF